MQSMHSVRVGIEIGKILFVKNPLVSFYLNYNCLILFYIKKEPPGPISNAGISTTKNGVTRLLRRGKILFLNTFSL